MCIYETKFYKGGTEKMNETVGVEELFGSKVFTRATMRERLPKNVYR